MEMNEKIHYVVVSLPTFAVFVLTMAIWQGMPEYQCKKRVSALNAMTVTFAWLDFIGDCTWTHQRFFNYFRRSGTPIELNLGTCSLIVLCMSVSATMGAIWFRVLRRAEDRRKLRFNYKSESQGVSYAFITILFVSAADPDALMFFPWTEEAFDKGDTPKDHPLPNTELIKLSLIKLIEDVPQFVLQVAHLALVGTDTFTVLNLCFTLIMLFYLVAEKLLVILQSQSDDSPQIHPAGLTAPAG